MGAVHRHHESENNWGEGMKLEKALTFKLQSWRGKCRDKHINGREVANCAPYTAKWRERKKLEFTYKPMFPQAESII